MRWWPPLLHLSLFAVLFILAWLRMGSVLNVVPAIQAATASADGNVDAPELPAAGLPIDLGEVLARPLFSTDRRQVTQGPEIVPSTESVTNRTGALRMVGYVTDGANSRAILTYESNGAYATVREGDVFEGFTVRSIQPGSVVLTERGEEITIRMFGQ